MKIDIMILDERLREEENNPTYAKYGDAGIDVRACIEKPIVLRPNEVVLIPLGFAMHIADSECAAILLPRSGQGHKDGIILGNSVGLIDSEYQGQVFASIWNRNKSCFNNVTIEPMQRIAQLVFIKVNQVEFNEVPMFETSERGDGGFGHTGQD